MRILKLRGCFLLLIAWPIPGCALQAPSKAPSRPVLVVAPSTPGAPAKKSPGPELHSSPTPIANEAGRACGKLGCLAFDSAPAAFQRVLLEQPRVLGLGEAHAPTGFSGVRSSTRRFAEELMPALKGRATDIVIELLLGGGRCGQATESAVAERQKPVTLHQADTNQNEFVTLGYAASALGIQPHALEPTCPEFQAVLDAGETDIARMLELIADTNVRTVDKLLSAPNADSSKLILVYGGALHNDLSPNDASRTWSYGPRLMKRTEGRYVALDVIVPEFIKDTPAWRALPWYAHYNADRLGQDAILFNPEAHSYVLVLPRSADKIPAPDLSTLQRLLKPHAGAKFAANSHEKGCPTDQTLGEYLAMLVRNGCGSDAPDDIHHLTGGCANASTSNERMPLDPPADPAYWFCRIDAYTSDREARRGTMSFACGFESPTECQIWRRWRVRERRERGAKRSTARPSPTRHQGSAVLLDRAGHRLGIHETEKFVEVDVGQKVAASDGSVVFARKLEELDASSLPDPHFLHPKLTVDLELVDASRGPDHFDG